MDKMREKLHNFIDWIFNTINEIYIIFYYLCNYIKLFCRKPKYKLHHHVYCGRNNPQWKMICHIYKDWKHNIFLYGLSDGINYSEGLLDYYKKEEPNSIERIYGKNE